MPTKKVVQDIIPSSRRSIKIVPLKRASRVVEEEIEEKVEIPEKKEIRAIPPKVKSTKKDRFSKIWVFSIIFICVIIIGIALSFVYSKAIITITPEKLNLNINGNFIAKKDMNSDDSLSYQVVTISDDASKTIEAIDGPLVQTKAKGAVTLYNSFSSTTQKIVAGTRLSSNSGLVYKTLNTVSIPGKKTVLGKVVFGAVGVDIIADQTGANYNIKLLDLTGDFKFVGYKDTPKYQGFFGRIKTEISGGFSGKNKIASADLEKTTNDDLQKSVAAKLLARVASVIPSGYVMFDNAYTIDYQRISTSTDVKNTENIDVKGTLYSVIFNSKSLVDYIAKKQIQDVKLTNYKVDGLNTLNFKIINTKDFSPKKENTLSFSLNGPLKVAGIISETDLKAKLVGLKVTEIDSVVKNDPSVKLANVLLTPFWMRSFPNSPESITIEYK